MFAPSAIRAEMARRRFTIADLSERTGLGTTTISTMLADDANPTVKSLEKVAKALGVCEAVFFEANSQDPVIAIAEGAR